MGYHHHKFDHRSCPAWPPFPHFMESQIPQRALSFAWNSSLQTFCIPKRNHQRESEKGQESKKVHPDQARNQSTGKEAGKHS